MSPDVAHLVNRIHDAGLAPEAWPEALNALTNTWSAAGAAIIIAGKTTTRLDWVRFSGLSEGLGSKYIEHYAALDPFSPLLRASPGWRKLSECLPRPTLVRSEWHNDFVLACGVGDILGTCFIDTPSYPVIFGLHQKIGRQLPDVPDLNHVKEALALASLRQVESLFGPSLGDEGTQTMTEGVRYYFHVVNGRQYRTKSARCFARARKQLR
jgi:hypothetical protein